jgi:hypothetical protein
VKVAADFPRRRERRRDVDAFEPFRRSGRKQRGLDTLRKPQFLFESFFVRADFFVQPGVLNRHCRLAGKQRQNLDIALAEGIELRALQIDDADASVLQQQRDGEF